MSNVQDNAAHTCSHGCDRPECIKAQRDKLAAAAAQEAVAGTVEIIGRTYLIRDVIAALAKAGYAAPVTAAPGLTAAVALCANSEPQPTPEGWEKYWDSTTTAPGIDLEQFRDVVDYWLADAEKLSPGIGRNGTIAYGKRLLALIDASPKGATLNEQFGSAEGFNVGMLVRDCCEAERADPDHPFTICISVDALTEIARRHALADSPKGRTCDTCNGHGMIGGLLPSGGGYESEQCPDCSPKGGSEARPAPDAIDWRRDSAEVIRDKITERASAYFDRQPASDTEVRP